MGDYGFYVYLAQNAEVARQNGDPNLVEFGTWLWSKMTQAEKDAFIVLLPDGKTAAPDSDGGPMPSAEGNLFRWGTAHEYDYSKESHAPEWVEWFYNVPPGTRLLMYSAAASQSQDRTIKNAIGDRYLPVWVMRPTLSKHQDSWFNAISPIRDLQRKVFARLGLPNTPDLFASLSYTPQPTTTNPDTTGGTGGTTLPGSNLTDTPGTTTGTDTPATASAGGSGMLWLGLLVLGLLALSDE